MQQWCNSCALQICSPTASLVLALSLSRKVGSDPGESLSLSTLRGMMEARTGHSLAIG